MAKKIVECCNENEFESLLGKKLILFCANYFYSGTLELVGKRSLLLSKDDAAIVYETGSFGDAKWKDEQRLGRAVRVRIMAIEAFAEGK